MPATKRRSTTAETLSIEHWRSAALRALADDGIAAVAIEPIAKKLGVTKGSGYWHFTNREALLRATLDEWESKTTEAVIAELERVADPRERLVALFRRAFSKTLDGRVCLALTAAEHEPHVAATLRRVSRRRIAFVSKCFEELSYSKAAARHRASVAYAAYLGVLVLRRHGADLAPAGERDAFIEHLIETLV
jgi:AcrR family transcriptional regulator